MTIRTIGELIAELQKWPASGLVDVALITSERGSGSPASIVEVSGYAGSAIDGHDSGVSLVIKRLPTWYPA